MSAITSLLHDFDQSSSQFSLGKEKISHGLDMGTGAAVAWTPHEGGVCVWTKPEIILTQSLCFLGDILEEPQAAMGRELGQSPGCGCAWPQWHEALGLQLRICRVQPRQGSHQPRAGMSPQLTLESCRVVANSGWIDPTNPRNARGNAPAGAR